MMKSINHMQSSKYLYIKLVCLINLDTSRVHRRKYPSGHIPQVEVSSLEESKESKDNPLSDKLIMQLNPANTLKQKFTKPAVLKQKELKANK